MTRRSSPLDAGRIVGIQRLNQTLAANDLAEARTLEARASEQLQVLEQEVEAGIDAWTAQLAARSVDPDQLQRLAAAISEDARLAAAAARDLERTREVVETHTQQLELAGANLKQAEALNRKLARRASRRAEEDAVRVQEERTSLAWGTPR